MQEEVYYFEHCMTTLNRMGRMLTREELTGKTGFRSVYGFDALASSFFREAGSTKGAKNFAVWSDELLMDFDDNETECERVVNDLLAQGFGVKVWNTGGRGQHVAIKHQPVVSRHLPYSQKAWLKSKGYAVDFCLYSHGHIVRLEGTRHAKTGNYKTLVFSHEGEALLLPLVEEPVRARRERSGGDDFDLEDFSNMLSWFVKRPPVNGERNYRLFALAAGLLSSGISSTAMTELVEKFNTSIDEPLEDEELALVLGSAINSVGE